MSSSAELASSLPRKLGDTRLNHRLTPAMAVDQNVLFMFSFHFFGVQGVAVFASEVADIRHVLTREIKGSNKALPMLLQTEPRICL